MPSNNAKGGKAAPEVSKPASKSAASPKTPVSGAQSKKTADAGSGSEGDTRGAKPYRASQRKG